MTIHVIATADIEPGEVTPRVKLRGPKGGKTRGKTPPERTTTRVPRRARPKRYSSDPSRGRHAMVPIDDSGTLQVCISMTRAELAQLDAYAKRVNMSRSEFLRRAFKAFATNIFDGGGQERRWRDALR